MSETCPKGVLLDTDVRWDIIAQSVDDRTPAERGVAAGGGEGGGGHEAMAGHGTKRLHKSRYETISTYICNTVIGQDGQDSSTRAALKELGRNDLEAREGGGGVPFSPPLPATTISTPLAHSGPDGRGGVPHSHAG